MACHSQSPLRLYPLPPSLASSAVLYAVFSYTNSPVELVSSLLISSPQSLLTQRPLAAFKIFLICMTNLLLLIGAGLFSKAVWAFQENAFIKLVGTFSDDTAGTGPGSYDVRGNVWHLNCCSASSGSWSIFYAIFGWQNSATCRSRSLP